MSFTQRSAPIAAVVAALATLACCLPLSFAGAAGLAVFSQWAGRARPGLIGASLALLALGFVQVYRRPSCSRSRTSQFIVWAALAVVVWIFLFPQSVAAWLA